MKPQMTRRELLQASMGAAAIAPGLKPGLPAANAWLSEAAPFNRNSAPSDLKITDMRACTVAANYDYPIIRIDTNQGVYGLGEVRDAGVKGIALILKAHIAGQEPARRSSPILADIRQFAGQGRMGGGYSAVDMALHDIAGQGLRRSGLAPSGDKVSRPHPHLLRHHRAQGPEDLRRAHARAQEAGIHVFQDGPLHQPGCRPARRGSPERRCHRERPQVPVRVHRGRARRHRLGCAAGSGPLRRPLGERLHPVRQGLRALPVGLGGGSHRLHGLARVQGHLRRHDHPHAHGRRRVRARGGIPESDREPCSRHNPARPGDVGRAARNQAHCGLRGQLRHPDRSPLCRLAGRMHGLGPPGVHAAATSSSWRTTPSTCPGGATW